MTQLIQPTLSSELGSLIDKMKALENESDIEGAHSDADSLLIEALEIIAAWELTSSEGELVKALVGAWSDVPKWYA